MANKSTVMIDNGCKLLFTLMIGVGCELLDDDLLMQFDDNRLPLEPHRAGLDEVLVSH